MILPRTAALGTTLLALLLGLTVVSAPAGHALAQEPQGSMPKFDGQVKSIVHHSGVVYVAGGFSTVTDAGGRVFERSSVAAVDASTGEVLRWNPRVVGEVQDLAASPEGIYLAGEFTRVADQPRENLALYGAVGSAGLDPRVKHTFDGPVRAVAAGRNKVFVGGGFTRADGKVRHRLAAFDRDTSSMTRWAPAARLGDVLDITARRGAVFLAGNFEDVNGKPSAGHLASVTQTRGRLITSFAPAVNKLVHDIDVSAGTVYAAIGGARGGQVAAFTVAEGRTAWRGHLDGDAQSIARFGDAVYVGGHFDNVCPTADRDSISGDCFPLGTGISRPKLAAYDLTGTLQEWNPGADGPSSVTAMTGSPAAGALFIGGDFTRVASNSDLGGYALFVDE